MSRAAAVLIAICCAAALAKREGWRGLVLKNHFVMTADRARASESLTLMAAAKQAGVRAIVVTHVFSGRPTEAQMAQMAGAGAIMEPGTPARPSVVLAVSAPQGFRAAS